MIEKVPSFTHQGEGGDGLIQFQKHKSDIEYVAIDRKNCKKIKLTKAAKTLAHVMLKAQLWFPGVEATQ